MSEHENETTGIGVTVAHITNNATFCRRCGKLKSIVTLSGGDSTGVSIPYEFCQCPPESQPSLTFKTDAELRAFVERCTAKYLDEKLDERVAKSLRTDPEIRAILTGAVDEHLDELAREFNENSALQPGAWRKE